MSRPVVIAFGRVTSGVHYHRIVAPLFAMREDVEVYLFQYMDEIPADLLTRSTHIIFSRLNPLVPIKHIKGMFDTFRKFGKKIIIDVDDWWYFPPDHPNRKIWEEKRHEDRCTTTMKYADEVWCASKYLAKKVKRYNKNVIVIPNAVDTNSMQWNQPKIKSDKVRFGYLGANYHQKDLLSTGLDLSKYESYAVGAEYSEILKTKYTLGEEQPNRYGLLYSSIDVSLVPLLGSEFSRCKSNLKLIEAAYTNTAVICSGVKPYKEHLTAINSFTASNSSQWLVHVDACSRSPLYVSEKANNLRESMAEFNLANVNELRIERLYL